MRKLLILLAITAAVVLAGACGLSEGGGSSAKSAREKAKEPTAVETVQVAYTQTAAERTARLSYEATTTGPATSSENSAGAFSTIMAVRADGVTDFSGAASSLTMRMPGTGNLEMRQVGETVYVKLPDEFAVQVSDAKPWLRMDLDSLYDRQYGGGPVQGGCPRIPRGNSSTCAVSPTPSGESGRSGCAASRRHATGPSWT